MRALSITLAIVIHVLILVGVEIGGIKCSDVDDSKQTFSVRVYRNWHDTALLAAKKFCRPRRKLIAIEEGSVEHRYLEQISRYIRGADLGTIVALTDSWQPV